MSIALMLVRFPDGTIRYGAYSGTSDIPGYSLFDKFDEENWRNALESSEPYPRSESAVPVEIFTNYGGGFHWRGTATPQCLVDCGIVWNERWEHDIPHEDGAPEWVPERFR